ncbi:MAG: hypothetical protein ACI9GW_002268 [Halieaceae bacterium]|jgi:hypothetical protein
METSMLTPALALITWTMVVWGWMYALRIPAMQAAGIDAQEAAHPGSLDGLPSNVRQVADNYNHLHEQPTIFYALVFYTQLTGLADGFTIAVAWTYVALRIVHSLTQCISNNVMLRFSVFCLSSITLIVLVGKNLLALT